MLVTITPRFRVHRDEVLSATVRENMVVLRFAALRTQRFAIDDLTPEAREWLIPALAPRDIPFDDAGAREDEAEPVEEEAPQANERSSADGT